MMVHRAAALFLLISVLISVSEGSYKIVGWGTNPNGQLGIGTFFDANAPQNITFPESQSSSVLEITVGPSQVFTKFSSLNVYVMGANQAGQLGRGSTSSQGITTPTVNGDLYNQVILSTGISTISRAPMSRNVSGWGQDGGHVLGAIRNNVAVLSRESSLDTQVQGKVVSIATANRTAFVILNDGSVYAAGKGYPDGTIAHGLGSSEDVLTLTKMRIWDTVPLLKIFPSASQHVCAQAKNMSIFCWGRNDQGQVGVGSTDRNVYSPTLVSFFEENQFVVGNIVYGANHTLAVTCGNRVFAWGSNMFGQLGSPIDRDIHSTPEEVMANDYGSAGIVEIVTTANSNWARATKGQNAGSWMVWGAPSNRNLFLNGKNADVSAPFPVDLSKVGINRIASGSQSLFIIGWQGTLSTNVSASCPPMVNECENSATCAKHASCTDTERSYICTCADGFEGDGIPTSKGGSGCKDVNECVTGEHNCIDMAKCVNKEEGFYCQCPTGYSGSGSAGVDGTGCTNINECLASDGEVLHTCAEHASCWDTVGSFMCSCPFGYRGDGYLPIACGSGCEDVNECENKPCSGNTTCNNLDGTFECVCLPGYAGAAIDAVGCKDINECATQADVCADHASCVNTLGGFNCTCNTGYAGDGYKTGTGCADMDECLMVPCDNNAVCINTDGSYKCTCESGYTGNGISCSDVDECASGAHKCDPDYGVCTNENGGYACSCKPGFSIETDASGSVCIDIDECLTGTNNCDPNAGCYNTIGDFTCSCNPGYTGNGRRCYQYDLVCPIGQYPQTASLCGKCAAGTYNTASGASECTNCTAGTYSATVGATTDKVCLTCPANKYSRPGASTCLQCPAGTWSAAGSGSCTPCPAGTYGFQGQCVNCGPGFFTSRAGLTECRPCAPGTYSASKNATSCSVCPAGSYSEGKSTGCTTCRAGTFTSRPGSYYCQMCPIGMSTRNLTGAVECTICPAGTYAPFLATTRCIPCSAGSYSALPGSNECKGCEPGSHQDKEGASSCKQCDNYQYQNLHGAVKCQQCYDGYQGQSIRGSKSCDACPIGTYRNGNMTSCAPCWRGSASNLVAQPNCQWCMGGQYADGCGFTSCKSCEPGTYSSYDAVGQERCSACEEKSTSFGDAYFCYPTF